MVLTSTNEAARFARAAILEQLAEGVIVTDASGTITFVNRAAASIHGVARLDIQPDDYSKTYHLYTEDGQPFLPHDLPLARAVRGETVRDARWRILRPDGSDVLAIGSAQPIRAPDGTQIGAVLTLRDDTARDAAERSLRQSEAALRELNINLAARVADRTRAAKAAQAEAEAASQAKSEFLAAMSHEIRTPLSSVLGYTDLLLEETSIDAAARLYGDRIKAAGSALLTIVNDILDFSKVEAGQIELVSAAFAPRHLAQDALSLVATTAKRKGLALRIETIGGLPDFVLGDRDRLCQVLLNLLNNAVKFTRAGEVVLRLQLSALDGGIAKLRFTVVDTGIGIPSSKRHRLFERFTQVDSSIQRAYGGTGLGLAISKRLIGLMNGTIDFESEVDRGSSFWFEVALPLATRQRRSEDVAKGKTTPRRLLLVEDIIVNQDLARAILERGGHEVDVASGGAEAVEAVQAKRYDLVLMDVQMPGIDGITATRMIRGLDHETAAVPIVAMTANVLPHQIAAFRDAGMQDHVGKPFRREVLFAVIERWARAADPKASDERIALDGFADLSDSLGRVEIDRLLASLAKELQSRLGPDGTVPDRQTLASDAHALASAAGMLGFVALSESCRDAESANLSEDEYRALVARMHALRRSALTAIDTRLAA